MRPTGSLTQAGIQESAVPGLGLGPRLPPCFWEGSPGLAEQLFCHCGCLDRLLSLPPPYQAPQYPTLDIPRQFSLALLTTLPSFTGHVARTASSALLRLPAPPRGSLQYVAPPRGRIVVKAFQDSAFLSLFLNFSGLLCFVLFFESG